MRILLCIAMLSLPGRLLAEQANRLRVRHAELGHKIDQYYHDVGTRVDTILFDIKELERQGSKNLTPVRNRLDGISTELRNAWLVLDGKRQRIHNAIDERACDADNKAPDPTMDIPHALDHLNVLAEQFLAEAKALVLKEEQETTDIRADLVYKPHPVDKDTWLSGYIRSLSVSYFPGSARYQAQFVYPGDHMDLEYVSKLSHDMGLVNIWNCGPDYRQHVVTTLQQHNRPYLLWATGPEFVDKDIVAYHYLEHKEDALEALRALDNVYYTSTQTLHGFYVDECVLYDHHKRYGAITNHAFFVGQFHHYLEQRHAYLSAHQIDVPHDINDVVLPPKLSSPLWMEWQMFKKAFSANHYQWLYSEAEKNNLLLLVLLMNKNSTEPQSGSWVSFGKRLPVLMTDLYYNGSVTEAMYMQLFENAVNGKAIMTPGAGYSCRTPDRFKRSISIAAAHASGIWIWTYRYLSKYRNANLFWRCGGKKANVDDRGRSMMDRWRPEYWAITEDVLNNMRNADELLANGESQANIVVLVSERSIIHASRHGQAKIINSHNLGLYSYLVQTGKPFDVCYLESTSAEKMKRYKLATLFMADAMTDSEVSTIREWVKQGGTLVAGGTSSLLDEWGRERSQYALANVYGVDYDGMAKREDLAFTAFTIAAEYASAAGLSRTANVSPRKDAHVLGAFKDGSPALIKHAYGSGTSFLMTSEIPGWIQKRSSGKRAALWGKSHPGFDTLLFHIISNEVTAANVVSMENHLHDDIAISIKKAGDTYVVHLIDWQDFRHVDDLKLRIHYPGSWRVYYPGDKDASTAAVLVDHDKLFSVRRFKIHEMIAIEPAQE